MLYGHAPEVGTKVAHYFENQISFMLVINETVLSWTDKTVSIEMNHVIRNDIKSLNNQLYAERNTGQLYLTTNPPSRVASLLSPIQTLNSPGS